MIILKCTKNIIQFQKNHNLLLNKNINKNLRDALDGLDNIITFKFYNKSTHSNFKIYTVNVLL